MLRFFMLSAHYRSPLNFSGELMESSKNGLERILNSVDRLRELREKAEEREASREEERLCRTVGELRTKYEEAMEDDFNTADAVSAVFEVVKLANSTAGQDSGREYVDYLIQTLETLCAILGINTQRKEESLDEEVEKLIAARQQARKEKNFALADQIRQKLLDMGIILEDTREGVKWKKA